MRLQGDFTIRMLVYRSTLILNMPNYRSLQGGILRICRTYENNFTV